MTGTFVSAIWYCFLNWQNQGQSGWLDDVAAETITEESLTGVFYTDIPLLLSGPSGFISGTDVDSFSSVIFCLFSRHISPAVFVGLQLSKTQPDKYLFWQAVIGLVDAYFNTFQICYSFIWIWRLTGQYFTIIWCNTDRWIMREDRFFSDSLSCWAFLISLKFGGRCKLLNCSLKKDNSSDHLIRGPTDYNIQHIQTVSTWPYWVGWLKIKLKTVQCYHFTMAQARAF